MDHFQAGVLVENKYREIIYVNVFFCELFRISDANDIIGTDCKIAAQASKVLFKEPEEFIRLIRQRIERREPAFKDMLEMTDGRILERDYIPVFMDNLFLGNLWVYRDNTSLKRKEQEVNRFCALQNIFLSISARFVNLPAEGQIKEFEDILGIIGKFMEAERSYLFEFNHTAGLMSNTVEWCAPGIHPEIGNLQNLPVELFPSWMGKLYNHEDIHIPSVKDLSDTWKPEREILESQMIQSLIVVPVIFALELLGFVGFDSITYKREWTPDEISVLRILADHFAGALHRSKIENELEKREQQYRTLVEAAGDPIFLLSADGKIIYINQAASGYLSLTAQEMIGKNSIELFPKEIAEQYSFLLKEVMTRKTGLIDESRSVIQGRQYWFSTSLQPLIDARGEVIAIQGIARDITPIKQTEAELIKSENKLKFILNSTRSVLYCAALLPDGIFQVSFVSSNLKQIIGYEEKDFINNPVFWSACLHPDDHEKIRESSAQLVKNGRVVVEYRFKHQDGRYRWLHDEQVLITHDDGAKEVIGSWFDITEKKVYEETLLKMNAEKDKFFSIIAHDLKCPFNVSMGFSDLLVSEFNTMTEQEKLRLTLKIHAALKNNHELLENLKTEWSLSGFRTKELGWMQ